MAGALDHQVGLIPEATYGTPLTPTTFLEWDLEKSSHKWDPKITIGSGMQVGDGGFQRASRSVAVLGQGSGQLGLDYQSLGMGKLIDSFFGNGTSTLVSGTTYQHNFTSALTGSLAPARTVEYGVVRSDTGGTVDAYRYAGVTFTKLTIEQALSEVLKVTAEWDARSQAKTTSPATASYPAGLGTPFHYGLVSSITFGGTVVLPTTTALASGGTAVSNLKSWSLELDNAPDTDDWALGGTRNQPRIGQRAATLKMSARYDVATYDDALLAHTTVPVTITYTDTSKALSTGFAQAQIVLPACKLQAADRPGPTTGTPTTDLELKVMKPDTGQAIYIVHRTTEATV